jgi:hypothetical protein
MDDTDLQVKALREEVDRLLYEKRALEEKIEQLTPRLKFVAILDPRKPLSALHWIQELV